MFKVKRIPQLVLYRSKARAYFLVIVRYGELVILLELTEMEPPMLSKFRTYYI